MRYYQVGIVDYDIRMMHGFREGMATYSDYYELGDIIPIITLFKKETKIDRYLDESCEYIYTETEHTLSEHIFWMTNTIENLKPGDPVCINISSEEMLKIKTDSRGVRASES